MSSISTVVFRLAEYPERNRIVDFINENSDEQFPLVNHSEWFEYYYCGTRLQFALAERDGELLAAAGYILANSSKNPDIWISVRVEKKGENGIGMELMNAVPGLTNARVISCNNIQADTCSMYHSLGWTAERVPHYYRLAPRASAADYHLCRPAVPEGVAPVDFVPEILPVSGDLELDHVSTVVRLHGLGMPETNHTPHKDMSYLALRYFAFPYLNYDVWSVHESGKLLAYLVTHVVNSSEPEAIPVLRILDFIGQDEVLPRMGHAIDALLQRTGAEYAECYCAGIPAEIFAAAGFTERKEGDGMVIPNDPTQPLCENKEYYYFTNQPEHFVLFEADGDQNRPHLSVE